MEGKHGDEDFRKKPIVFREMNVLRLKYLVIFSKIVLQCSISIHRLMCSGFEVERRELIIQIHPEAARTGG